MPSFEIFYEGDEDFLEVTFASFDETFSRSFALNDHIILHTDLACAAAWGITFTSYRVLLQVNETHLHGLEQLEARDVQRIVRLLSHFPVNAFLQILDLTTYLAMVKAPALDSLL